MHPLTLMAFAWVAPAQQPVLEATLTAPAPTQNESFGAGLDLDGDWALCSSNATVQGVPNAGLVYVYRATGSAWSLDAILSPPDPQVDRQFGWLGLEYEDDFIYVATPSGWADTSLSGKVHVYQRIAGAWQHVAELVASQAADAQSYASGLAVQGDTVAVVASTPSASVYVYRRQALQWVEEARLDPPSPTLSLRCIDLDGDRLVVASLGNGSASYPGAAWVYRRQGSTWNLEATLTSGNPNPTRDFGEAVAIDGDVIACSAVELGLTPGQSRGEVSLFEFAAGAWSEVHRVQAPTASFAFNFGGRIALHDDRLLIADETYRQSPSSPPIGAVWQFRRTGPSWASSIGAFLLPTPSPTSAENYGYTLDASLGRAIGGSSSSVVAGQGGAGLVHIHKLGAPVETICEAAPGTCFGQLSTAGAPSASANTPFSISLSGVQGQRTALLFYGVSGRIAQPWHVGGGVLCVPLPAQRTPLQSTGGTFNVCDGSAQLDWNAYQATHLGALGQPWSAGDRVQMQAWSRNPAASSATVVSATIEFLLQP